MRLLFKQFLLLFFLLVAIEGKSQTIGGLRLKRDYRGQLDLILEEMGKEMNIRFVLDKEYLSKYNTSLTTYEDKTINGVLKLLKNAWGMASYIGDDGYIYIARDEAKLAEIRGEWRAESKKTEAKRQDFRGRLTPIKRNFLLSGNIVDKTNGERIPYASIHLHGTNRGISSDANGHFALDKVPTDTATVVVSYIGYETQYVELTPGEDNSSILVEMEPQRQEIAEVFILGRKDDKALEQQTVEHKIKMSPIALKTLPNVGERDIMRGFQLMPGVSATNENSSGMHVRGGTPDQNLIIYDGFTVYYVDHLHGFYSAFNSNAVKDVQLYKGGFESKFGGRLSSVTEITGKDGNNKKFSVGAEASLLSVNAYLELPIGDKFTSLFAFRRSYQGYLYNKISGQSKNSDNVVSRPSGPRGGDFSEPDSYFYDVNAKLSYNATSRDIFSVSFFNGTDYLDNTPSFGMPGGGFGGGGNLSMDNSDYTRSGNVGVSARWIHKWNERLTSNTLASYSKFYSTRDQQRSMTVNRDSATSSIKSGTLEKNNLNDYSVKSDWNYSLNDWNNLSFGAFVTHYDIDYTYSQTDTASVLDKSNKANIAGLYLQDKMQFLDNKITLTPGVRTTFFDQTKKWYFEPRLSASYQLFPQITINAATGLYYQFANRVVREDVMSGNSYFWILSDNKDIPVSRSIHYNLGLNYDLPDYLFSIEGYYKQNTNISEYTMRFKRSPSRDGGVETLEQFYTGNGYSTGLEFLAQKKAGSFNGWISYTISEVKNRFPEQSSKYYYAYQDATHEVKVVGIYKFGNFDFSATWIYSTGRPYTAPLGAYTVTLLDGTEATYYAISDKNTFRLPDYHRLDLSASYRFNLFGSKGKPNAISISLFNAYNRKNVSAKQFELIDNTILESNINYLSITPNISLVLKY